MATSDSRPPGSTSLHEGIDELESLLKDRPASSPAQIPVLDELAEATASNRHEPAAAAPAGVDPRQLAELARRLEHRVEAELADLAGVIRSIVKRCILEELRAWLPPARPGAAQGEDRKPEPPINPRAPD